jgi:hypothetical protein
VSPSPEIRALRHELLNQVNHIVGYAELILEDVADGAGPADPALADGLGDVCAAGKEVLAVVTAILDPAGDGFDPAALTAALADPLERVLSRAGELAGVVPHEAVETLGRIASAASRAKALAGGAAPPAAAGPAEGTGERVDLADPVGVPDGPSSENRGLVLVVDDDAANRDVLARRLGRLGYAVCEADNGRRALELMAARPVDLVLLDLNMPGVDGYAVLQARQADAQLRDIPTIMISKPGSAPAWRRNGSATRNGRCWPPCRARPRRWPNGTRRSRPGWRSRSRSWGAWPGCAASSPRSWPISWSPKATRAC